MSGTITGPPASTYARRRIDLAFQLGQGSFGNSGYDTINLTGLRVSAAVVKAGDNTFASMQMRVYGMTLSAMNQLSTLGKPRIDQVRNNSVSLSAGTDGTGMSLVFNGTIDQAWVDTQSAPNVAFVVTAVPGLVQALKPVTPLTYRGPVDAATILSGLATEMGYAFENNGVSVILSNSYFPGTAMEQAKAVAKAANIEMVIDTGANRALTMSIWPRDGVRGGLIPLISPQTGMIGYPTFTQNGIVVTTLFNPTLNWGGLVEVQTDLLPAQGRWTIFELQHILESEVPGGSWFTQIVCSVLGHDELPIQR